MSENADSLWSTHTVIDVVSSPWCMESISCQGNGAGMSKTKLSFKVLYKNRQIMKPDPCPNRPFLKKYAVYWIVGVFYFHYFHFMPIRLL